MGVYRPHSKGELMKKLNIVFSVVLIAVAAFFFFYADTFKTLPGQTEIGPGASPRPSA